MEKIKYPATIDKWTTLVELLRWRADHHANRRLFTFLQDGELEEIHLTFGELDQKARAIAALLQKQGMIGQRALLLFPPGLDYIATFFGCLYAGVIAVPVYPPKLTRLDRSLPRLQAIINNAQSVVALTTTPILSMAENFLAQAPNFQALRWMAADTIGAEMAVDWYPTSIERDSIAFLQYTSGSTAVPKGVMVSHGNLLHNEALIQRAFEITADDIGVGWLPLYHDMGLIGTVLQPIYTGFHCILMSPLDFLQKPIRWLQAITRYQATLSGGPNFAYDLCARKITPEQRTALDLHSWRVALNGSEPIRPDTIEQFLTTFESVGFRPQTFFPCYGLAEATLFVSGGPVSTPPVQHHLQATSLETKLAIPASQDDANTRLLVGCGQVWPEQHVVIVNPETKTACSSDQIGEVWIAGSSVAHGYWQKPDASAYTFGAYLADTGEGPFLRTGDLGFLQDGELFIVSRLKDLIIIRGRNHAPQDIELTVEKSHPALRQGCGVAFSVEVDSEEQLVIVQEVKRQYRDVDVTTTVNAIRQAVTEHHELQIHDVVLLKPGGVPKTSSGKLQRRACRANYLDGNLEKVIAHDTLECCVGENDTWTETITLTVADLLTADPNQRPELLRNYLHQQLAQTLHVPPAKLGDDQPFTAFGLDSLKALELKSQIELALQLEFPLVTFMEHPTIAQLSEALLKQIDVQMVPHSDGDGALFDRLDQLSEAEVNCWLDRLVREEI